MDKDLQKLNNLLNNYKSKNYTINGSKIYLSQNIFEEIIQLSKIYNIQKRYRKEIYSLRNDLSHNKINEIQDGSSELEKKQIN